MYGSYIHWILCILTRMVHIFTGFFVFSHVWFIYSLYSLYSHMYGSYIHWILCILTRMVHIFTVFFVFSHVWFIYSLDSLYSHTYGSYIHWILCILTRMVHIFTVFFQNIDLTRHKLVYDGQLTWRISRQKQIDLHVVLLEDILVLLQKQDDKLVLKCQSTNMVVGKDDTKNTHSPIIKLVNLLTRNVAIDKRAFFLVNTSDNGPQIYELVAMSSDERRK